MLTTWKFQNARDRNNAERVYDYGVVRVMEEVAEMQYRRTAIDLIMKAMLAA